MDDKKDPHSALEKYDAGHHYEHAFDASGLKENEKSAAGAGASIDKSDDIQSQEESPTQWANKTTPQSPRPKQGGIKGFISANKKKGPAGIIITLLIGGGASLSFLTPGLLLLHVTETITDKMNMQFPSMDIRTNKVLSKKISNQAASGVCTQKVTIRCKFNSLNDRQLESLRKAGITVNLDENTTITGRHRVTSMDFKGKAIDPANLTKQLRGDPALRSAFKSAYNSKFAGYADKVWTATTGRLGISKQATFKPGVTDEERTEEVKKRTKDGVITSDGRIYSPVDPENPDGEWTDGKSTIDRATAEARNAELDDLKTGIDGLSTNGEKNTGKVLEAAHEALEQQRSLDVKSLVGGALGGVASGADAACTFYGMYRAVSFGAKTIRSVQMARYAMMFLNTASMIKSGDATAEDVTYFGDLLTKTVNEETVDENGGTVTTTSKSATDSYGYRYAAYGDTGPLTPSAAEFTAGGGLGGKMDGIANQILSVLPGDTGQKDILRLCGVIKSPFGQVANVVVSIGLIVFGGPVGWGALLASIGGGAVADLALSTAQSILTPILGDMVAGILVDDSTFGEKSGDALVSGSGVIMSTVAGIGGNAPLKPEQAVAYMGTQQEVLAQYAEEERLTHNPLDPTSPYTFMGRIVGQLVPYSSQTKTVSSITSISLSVAKRSLATIFTPSAFAAENTVETYTQCDDMDYRELKLATDPFCNPIRGIPSEYLDADPVEVLDRLITYGDIDENDGQPKSDRYKKFIADCIDRDRPLGDSGDNFDLDDGRNCFIDDEGDIPRDVKAEWYIYHIDQRVIDGMEEGYEIGGPSCGPSGGGATGTKMSDTEVKQQITSYGLDAPTADGPNGYTALLEKLKSNPDASWAAQQMLNGEKNYKTKGGDVKEYLNTAWLWFENGSAGWPDPYEINCVDTASLSRVSFLCNSSNFQVAGYQAENRKGDYIEMFKKFYSDDELTSVLKSVVENSSKASQAAWKYNDPGQQTELVSEHLGSVDSATLGDISPNKDFFDRKAQFLTLMLGKDPNIAAGLNSFAVSDGDLVKALQGDGYGYIGTPEKELLSNMIYALYMFDGSGPTGSEDCLDPADGARGSGVGIAAVWGGVIGEKDLSYGFGAKGVADWYNYATAYGTDGTVHTGTDIPMDPYAPVYSPIEGIVVCEKNGVGEGMPGVGCAGSGDYSGTKEYGEKCTTGYDSSQPKGAGTVMIKITENGKETGEALRLGHLAGSLVKLGQTVQPNQQIGTAGCMNGWHTHVEYFVPSPGQTSSGMKLVDPVEYL